MTSVQNVQTTAQEAGEKKSPSSRPSLLPGYIAFACVCFTVGEHYSERDYSSLLTLANAFHLLGAMLLRIFMECTQSTCGISVKTIVLSTVAIVFRLSSTLWLAGYIPTDETGNWVYQAADVLCFLTLLSILHGVYRRFPGSYDAEKDDHSPSMLNIFMLAVLMANVAHGDLNDRPLFDIAWFIGFYLDCLAVIPQLFMLWHSSRGSTEVVTGHYVWPVVSRVLLSYAFFFYAFGELASEDCPTCVNYVGYAMIAMHSLQLAFVVAIAALKVEKSLPQPDAKFTEKFTEFGLSNSPKCETELSSLPSSNCQVKEIRVVTVADDIENGDETQTVAKISV